MLLLEVLGQAGDIAQKNVPWSGKRGRRPR
jgi:hypothetical protein